MNPKTGIALVLAAGLAFVAGLALAPGNRSSPSGPGAPVSGAPPPAAPATAPSKSRIDPPPASKDGAVAANPGAPSGAQLTGPPLPDKKPEPGKGDAPRTGEGTYNPPSLGSGKDGEGEVIDFHAPFKTKEEREAWEAARKKRWEERLKKENDAAVALMIAKLGVSAGQADEVRRILDEQLASRNDLIAKLKSGEVGRPQMEEKVRAIKDRAHTRLKAVLTPAQYEGYLKLDPREQVLSSEANAPK